MKFITLENLKFFWSKLKDDLMAAANAPGKIEYWCYQLSPEELKKTRRLHCDGSILKIEDYPRLYKVFVQTYETYKEITNIEEVKKGDYFNEDGLAGYYGEVTVIDVDNRKFTYVDAGGFTRTVNFKEVTYNDKKVTAGGEYGSEYGNEYGNDDSGIDNSDPNTWTKTRSFYRKIITTSDKYGNVVGKNIIYKGVSYPANQYFQLPDLREVSIIGAGTNETYNGVNHQYKIHDHDIYSIGEFKDDSVSKEAISAAVKGENGATSQINSVVSNINEALKTTASKINDIDSAVKMHAHTVNLPAHSHTVTLTLDRGSDDNNHTGTTPGTGDTPPNYADVDQTYTTSASGGGTITTQNSNYANSHFAAPKVPYSSGTTSSSSASVNSSRVSEVTHGKQMGMFVTITY